MSEVLLARHAKSFANGRDPAFGNTTSPLDPTGRGQARDMNSLFKDEHSIAPEEYDDPVLASEYLRPQQTADLAGFRKVHVDPIINESEVPMELLAGRRIVEKHAGELWIPDELRVRTERFLNLVRDGKLGYQIYFTHGLFIASVLKEVSGEHSGRGEESPHTFDPKRGYIPKLATITPVSI